MRSLNSIGLLSYFYHYRLIEKPKEVNESCFKQMVEIIHLGNNIPSKMHPFPGCMRDFFL